MLPQPRVGGDSRWSHRPLPISIDLAEDLSQGAALGTRREFIQKLTRVGLVVIEDLGMRRLPPTAAEDLLEILTRRYELGATVISSNRPIDGWGQVLGDTAAAGAMLDRFLHHAEIVQLERSQLPDARPPATPFTHR